MQIKTTRLLKDWAGRLVRRAGWVDPHAEWWPRSGWSISAITHSCLWEWREGGWISNSWRSGFKSHHVLWKRCNFVL